MPTDAERLATAESEISHLWDALNAFKARTTDNLADHKAGMAQDLARIEADNKREHDKLVRIERYLTFERAVIVIIGILIGAGVNEIVARL